MVALDNSTSSNAANDTRIAIDALKAARTVVIKVGSALLVDDKNNTINQSWLAGISEDIAALQASGASVIVVSSGAIALGSLNLGISKKKLQLEEKQAAAAAGQAARRRALTLQLHPILNVNIM